MECEWVDPIIINSELRNQSTQISWKIYDNFIFLSFMTRKHCMEHQLHTNCLDSSETETSSPAPTFPEIIFLDSGTMQPERVENPVPNFRSQKHSTPENNNWYGFTFVVFVQYSHRVRLTGV